MSNDILPIAAINEQQRPMRAVIGSDTLAIVQRNEQEVGGVVTILVDNDLISQLGDVVIHRTQQQYLVHKSGHQGPADGHAPIPIRRYV